ncbi:unnamed protein product [Arabis nemorensis]|uniref:Spermatogenesis-associated protein 20-like TRX domain-containing protein n=1 Tax=Arabis nemorensis TaxID=586526 RepID=A0A565C0A2_9BRAS|nr:unnamed protein product [Arabis nemorensis]
MACLEALENILKDGEAEKNLDHVNLYASMIVEAEGHKKIQNLQSHENNDVNQKAAKILKTFWTEDGQGKDEKHAPQSGKSFCSEILENRVVLNFRKKLNDWFVRIKVDREERPDVDKVYMSFVQALYGGGGWPLSVFLSPDLKPLMGGTYFPPNDNYGRPGFKTILKKVKDAWDSKKDTLVKSSIYAMEELSKALSANAETDKLPDGLSRVALSLCAKQLSRSYDSEFGGFGSAPKFPRPVEIQLMLYHSKKLKEAGKTSEADEDQSMVLFSLQGMANGGMHDHIGGGFHRYSVDECWHVPHFEKMLYDQGQLANVYLDGFIITKDVMYSYVARDILDYLRRDMIAPEGGIFSAEDADSFESEGAKRKKEGAFYIWTSDEIDEVLGENADLFKEHYYVKKSGNCDLSSRSDPHNEFAGKNVLIERNELSAMASKFSLSIEKYQEILGECRRKLFDVRLKRPKPHLDDKIIVSWNGLVISSFARASKILKAEPESTKYGFPVVNSQDELYLDREGGAYFNTQGQDPSVLLRVKEDHGGAEPSGNSVYAINLVRLASIVAGEKADSYLNTAHRLLAVFELKLREMAVAVPLMCCAADMISVPSRKQVVLVIHIDPSSSNEMEFWEDHNSNVAEMAKRNRNSEKVVALVCQHFTCSPPVFDSSSLTRLLCK